jgi:hypothetical protein
MTELCQHACCQQGAAMLLLGAVRDVRIIISCYACTAFVRAVAAVPPHEAHIQLLRAAAGGHDDRALSQSLSSAPSTGILLYTTSV